MVAWRVSASRGSKRNRGGVTGRGEAGVNEKEGCAMQGGGPHA